MKEYKQIEPHFNALKWTGTNTSEIADLFRNSAHYYLEMQDNLLFMKVDGVRVAQIHINDYVIKSLLREGFQIMPQTQFEQEFVEINN